MDNNDNKINFDIKNEAENFFNKVLMNDNSNVLAMYGKSLICYHDGKIEESAELLNSVERTEPFEFRTGIHVVVDPEELKKRLVDLLEPQPPVTLDIMDLGDIRRQYEELQIERLTNNPAVLPEPPFKPRQQINELNFFCSVCKKGFTKLYSLNRHIMMHEGIKNHACDICGRTFIQKSDMQRHRTTHSNEFPIECSYPECFKRFKTMKNMRNHIVTHSTDRPYQCSYCEKAFKIKRLLQFHETLHNDMRPYSCDNCGKKFTIKAYLKSHLVRHISEKPFACPMCDSAYKRRYDLNVHIKRIHF